MNPKQPVWAKELKEKGINYAVLRYISSPQSNSSATAQPQPGGMPASAPITISAGAGPDGVVQPNRTAMVDQGTNPPSKYHEGELITIHNDGVRNITPAQQSAMQSFQVPSTMSQQSQMDHLPLPGYATGGTTYPDVTQQANPSSQTSGIQPSAAPSTVAGSTTQSGSPAPTADPVTTPTVQPSELSTIGKGAVTTGLDLLNQTAKGENPYLKNYGNQQLAEQSAANAAGNAATMAAAKRAGTSIPALSTISQEGTRQAENAQNTLRSTIYSKQQEAALNAADSLISQGQAVRTYEDVTLPTAQQNIESAKAAADAASRKSVYDLVKERNLAGVWGDQLVNDAQIRAQVKTMLGETATADDISREVGIIESALLDESREVFNTQVDNTLSDMIENGYTLDQALNDETLLKKAAGYLRINDLSSPEKVVQAKEELSKRWAELGKPDALRAYDNIVRNIIEPTMPELIKNSEFSKDMKATIGDLMTKGVVDADGNIKTDVAFDWPWDDPDTYFKYHDWNGNDVFNGEYDQTVQLSIDGNGSKYKTSTGNPVTMADVNAVWNSPQMSSSAREKYFDEDGSFRMDSFLKDYGFKPNVEGDISLTTPDEYEDMVINNADFEKKVTDGLREFNSTYNTVEITEGTGETAVTSKASDSGKFVYYDKYGVQQTGDVMTGELGYIWQQLSDNAGLEDGELLSAKAFADMWKNGEGWRVDKNGKIVNLWDKDAPGIKNEALRVLSEIPLNDQVKGEPPSWSTEDMVDFSVSKEEVTAIIHDEVWKDPQYASHVAEPGALERLFSEKDIGDWLRANVGKLYIGEDGTPYIIQNDKGIVLFNTRDNEQYDYKPFAKDFQDKGIVKLNRRAIATGGR